MALHDGHHRERSLMGPLFASLLAATAAGAVAAERAGLFRGGFGGDRAVASDTQRTAEAPQIQVPVETEPHVVYRENLPEAGRAGAVQLDDSNCAFFRGQGVSDAVLRQNGC